VLQKSFDLDAFAWRRMSSGDSHRGFADTECGSKQGLERGVRSTSLWCGRDTHFQRSVEPPDNLVTDSARHDFDV
jgi:hypothetical protein